MPNFQLWLNRDAERAVRTWQRILEKPSEIVLVRGTTELAAQTLRLEYSSAEREATGEDGAVSIMRDVLIFGVCNHPDASIEDTAIQRGDRFAARGQVWEIDDVIFVHGGLQAKGRVMS